MRPQHGTPDHVRDRDQRSCRNRPEAHPARSEFGLGRQHPPGRDSRKVGRPRRRSDRGHPPQSTRASSLPRLCVIVRLLYLSALRASAVKNQHGISSPSYTRPPHGENPLPYR
jgi:hypothetical protein